MSHMTGYLIWDGNIFVMGSAPGSNVWKTQKFLLGWLRPYKVQESKGFDILEKMTYLSILA